MGSGCGNLIVENVPSSSGQLPVPVALDARLPTLFSAYYTRFASKCKVVFCVSFLIFSFFRRLTLSTCKACRLFSLGRAVISLVFPRFRGLQYHYQAWKPRRSQVN